MKIELVDQHADHFDDLWVYRIRETQPCCIYAVNEDGHTPIVGNIALSDSYNSITTVMLRSERRCSWVLRYSLSSEQADIYINKISELIRVCDFVNYTNSPEITPENPLKLSDLLGFAP
ncbi:hypothetical protein DU972_003770 [Vibrio mimicus]|uniref:hypothetical protein n=1 Tax=Vibrio cholerae TaxID=666 RepID=UPI000C9C6986|nr:hypothetical protein [Vibrio cholerae]